jgi:heme-degrading monooxygenase HmoA
MTIISRDNDVYTLINVFTVAPDKQQQLVDTLIETTERVIKHIPGFVSASFHKSLDGTRVVNYAQWESREAFERVMQNGEARKRMVLAQQIGQTDGHFYTVSAVVTSG